MDLFTIGPVIIWHELLIEFLEKVIKIVPTIFESI